MRRSDAELINSCKSGDETAWEEIVFRYQNLIFSIARRSGLSKDLASEVLQEVFLALLQKVRDIEKPEFLKAWLITTTRHKIIRLIEREKLGIVEHLEEMNEDSVNTIPDSSLPTDEVLTKLEREQQVEAAISILDERCRSLLKLLYYEDEPLPYSDIARELNISLGSIGPTRARCLKKLMKLLP